MYHYLSLQHNNTYTKTIRSVDTTTLFSLFFLVKKEKTAEEECRNQWRLRSPRCVVLTWRSIEKAQSTTLDINDENNSGNKEKCNYTRPKHNYEKIKKKEKSRA